MNEENDWDGIVEADIVYGLMHKINEGEVMRAIVAIELGKAKVFQKLWLNM